MPRIGLQFSFVNAGGELFKNSSNGHKTRADLSLSLTRAAQVLLRGKIVL